MRAFCQACPVGKQLIVAEAGAVEQIMNDLHGFAQLLDAHDGLLGDALRSPVFTTEEREAVLERCSFAFMRDQDEAFAPPRTPLVPREGPLMMRRGVSGGSGEMLDAATRDRVDALCKRELARLASPFPYDDAFAR